MTTQEMELDTVRKSVREHYGKIATRSGGCGCAPACCSTAEEATANFTIKLDDYQWNCVGPLLRRRVQSSGDKSRPRVSLRSFQQSCERRASWHDCPPSRQR